MNITTLKTIGGFLLAVLERYTPLQLRGDSLEEILNYLPVSDTIASSGQPTVAQLKAIKGAGYAAIVNLLPENYENLMKDEAERVGALGMEYINIPVEGLAPTDEDFRRFAAVLKQRAGEKVWVHCAVNARASVFLYRYRCSVLGEDPAEVIWSVREIWEPFGVWKEFMLRPPA